MNKITLSTIVLLFFSKILLANKIDFIIINKQDRQVILYNKGKEVKSFSMSLGFEPLGKKIKKGDGKTPEGLYHIEEKLNQSSFYLALKISYPNPWDIRRALNLNHHPGGQIMIHGFPNNGYDLKYHNKLNDWTEGCIALSNKEMLYLWKKVNKGMPVLIRK